MGKNTTLLFSRDRRRARWAAWPMFLLLATVVHLLVIAALAWLPARPREKKSPLPPQRHVVQLQRSTPDSPVSPRPTGRVSTEDSAAVRDTVKEEPRVKPRPAVSSRPPRPRPAPPAPPAPPPAAPTPEEAARPSVSVERPAEREAETPSAPVKLFPTPEEAERILGITPETVPDATSGKENAINSQKWLGASFFLRVREAVAQAWDPERVYRAHDPDGRVYGYKNWFTVLSITLDANGRLLEPVIIAQPSGLRFLDLEAIRALRAAAPFLNPPKEIVDPATGRIKFRFGFLVEVNAGLNFRMFRF